jgi:hypothetical protein
MLENPSRKIRVLRVLMQTIVRCTPSSFWLDSYIGKVWRTYHRRSVRGEKLARTHLSGTALIPAHIAFPPQKIRVKGWPRSIMVSEATERVECTLYQRLSDLARERRFAEVELWLNRLLDLRQAGWKRGLFSVDTHLKNFGVTADRVVLLDSGGLTDRWHEVESRLAFEDVVAEPHIQLGLGRLLGGTPEIAQRFNARWKSVVNPSVVRHHWSGSA